MSIISTAQQMTSVRAIDGAGEAVTVPADHVRELLITYLQRCTREREGVREEVRRAVDGALAAMRAQVGADAYVLDARTAYWLQDYSSALVVYGLDETADESYEHPAVVAEHGTYELLLEHAPRTCYALDVATQAELERLIAAGRDNES